MPHRQRDQHQHGEHRDRDERRAAHDLPGEPSPERRGGGRLAVARPRQPAGVHAPAEHGQQCGQHHDRGGHRDEHHADPGVGERAQEVQREDQQHGERGHDRRAAEHDRAPGRLHAAHDRLRRLLPAPELLPEAADHQQRVVDGQRQAKRGGQVDRVDRHAGHRAEHVQLGERAEDRDHPDRQGQQRGHDAAEREHQQHQDDRHGDHLGAAQALADLCGDVVADRRAAADRDVDLPAVRSQARQHRRAEIAVALGAAQDERVLAVLRPQAGIARLPVGHHVRHARHRRKTARRRGARCSRGRAVNRPGLGVDEQDDTDGATETLVGQRLRGCRLGARVLEAAGLQLAERAEPEHAEPDHDQHRRDQHQTGAADHETSYRPGRSAPLPIAPQGRAPAFCSGHVMLPFGR